MLAEKDSLKALREILSNLQNAFTIVRKELRAAPAGKLYIQKKGSYTAFTRVRGSGSNRVRNGIGKKPDLVVALGHKQYNLELKSRLETNIAAVKKAIEASRSIEPEMILSILPQLTDYIDKNDLILGKAPQERNWPNPVREGIHPRQPLLRIDVEPQIWAAEPYRENTSYLELKTKRSAFGVMCRSKSELGLLGIYDEFGLFYHSDEVLRFDDEYHAADFIGCRADGTLIYHEHLGLQDEAYRQKYRRQELLYAKCGIIPGRNLIYTYDDENGDLDLQLAREIIRSAYKIN